MLEIAAAELKAKLEAGEPLSVIDIREAADFAGWHIHGSNNVPVYDSLRLNDDEPLIQRSKTIPKDQSIVTVCKEGVISKKAADLLRSLGYDARSLAGGMRGWGGIWSEAPIPYEADPQATFVQIRRNGKGCLSYLFGASGQAAVVDPSVDVRAYQELAEREKLKITHVLETHVHADHLSRARELARAADATLVLPPNGRAVYPFRAMVDGESLEIGGLPVEAVATPGHTTESTCYLVGNALLLTGDTLFVDAVGRPDLEKGDEGAEVGARMLFQSLRERLLGRFGDIPFYPAHHGKPMGFERTPIGSSLEAVRSKMSIVRADEEEFVRTIVDGLGEKPGNHATIIAVNEGKSALDELDALDLEAGPNRCAAC